MPGLLMVAVYSRNTDWALAEEFVERIRTAAGDSYEVFQARSDEDVAERLPEAEIIFGSPLSEETLPRAALRRSAREAR